jgi:RNA polymerase sigma-70 factor (ECF subfamily)
VRQTSQPSNESQAATADPATAPESAAAGPRLVDSVLLRRVRAGDPHAFTELVLKYQDRVFNACLRICGNREDAADATQEAFMKAFAGVDRFRGASAFYTWIFRIAVNLALSQQRKQRVRTAQSLNATTDEQAPLVDRLADGRTESPADRVAASETQAQVQAALARLEPDYRVAVVLRDIEGCDYQEIADILEVPVGTVRSRIHRGRAGLAALLLKPQPTAPQRPQAVEPQAAGKRRRRSRRTKRGKR